MERMESKKKEKMRRWEEAMERWRGVVVVVYSGEKMSWS